MIFDTCLFDKSCDFLLHADDVTTNGVIAELLGRINQLEESLSQVTETVKGQNQTIRELKSQRQILFILSIDTEFHPV